VTPDILSPFPILTSLATNDGAVQNPPDMVLEVVANKVPNPLMAKKQPVLSVHNQGLMKLLGTPLPLLS
jgi:hypothetical protein